MSRTRWYLERASAHVTRLVGERWGESFPFYYVIEHPKSGGSWLADMLADYLQISRPRQTVFPIGCRAVVHGHWRYSPRLRRVFYLVRDGRDVAISTYFRALGEIEHPPYATTRTYHIRRFPSLVDPRLDPRNPKSGVLARFIEEWVRYPVGTSLSWSAHVEEWAFGRPHVSVVRYEDLLQNAAETLARVLPAHTGEAADAERLAETARKYSFERQSGRRAGVEERGAILRKGVAGDWRNHFTRAAGEVFDRHCGESLVRLGYEGSRDWYEDLPD